MLRVLLISAVLLGVLAYAYSFTAWQALPLCLTVGSAVVGADALNLGDMDEGGALVVLALVMALITAAAGFI